MATELVTLTWCDLHQIDDGERVPASTWTVSVSSGDLVGAWELDVCEACSKGLRDTVHELSEYGRPVKGGRPAAARRPAVSAREGGNVQTCPVSGCPYTTTTPTGLNSHCRTAHGQTLAELTGSASIACPVPGCERRFGKGQGLASHLRVVHPDHPPYDRDADRAAAS